MKEQKYNGTNLSAGGQVKPPRSNGPTKAANWDMSEGRFVGTGPDDYDGFKGPKGKER